MLLHSNVLIGRNITVEGVVGEGAFGEVYRVRHRLFGVLAMKVFKSVGMTRHELTNSMKEPILLRKLNHQT